MGSDDSSVWRVGARDGEDALGCWGSAGISCITRVATRQWARGSLGAFGNGAEMASVTLGELALRSRHGPCSDNIFGVVEFIVNHVECRLDLRLVGEGGIVRVVIIFRGRAARVTTMLGGCLCGWSGCSCHGMSMTWACVNPQLTAAAVILVRVGWAESRECRGPEERRARGVATSTHACRSSTSRCRAQSSRRQQSGKAPLPPVASTGSFRAGVMRRVERVP